ncbi:DMT family transporter [Pseudopelagicola sp. nBUS_19]|uniref:DMT family transporter n=1 Tax=Pseudopelagicola sp. nBUS_19 TaxID=3395316 RepID=UPI003EBBD2F0
MEIWILASIAAALFQSIRFMLQKYLSQAALSATGATFARFVYSAPLSVIILLCVIWWLRPEINVPATAFWAYGLIGGVAQIIATVCTVMLLRLRNLAVGMTLIKSEILLTAFVGYVALGERISSAGLFTITLGVIGVLVLSKPMDGAIGWRRFLTPSAALGLFAGTLFAVSAVCYRGATLEVDSDLPLLRALITLAFVTTMQMVGLWIWLCLREPGETGRVLIAWRSAGFIGLSSLAGSLCWFVAFTLQNAAYVKAVGQVELIFGIMITLLIFRERIGRHEYMGMALLSTSIVGLVMLT